MAGRQFVGWSTVDPSQGYTLYDVDLIKRDIMNEFATRLGERVMLPNYGTIIWDLLFEPLTDNVKEQVVDDARRVVGHDSRVAWQDYNLQVVDYGILLSIDLTLVPFNSPTTLFVTFQRNSANRNIS